MKKISITDKLVLASLFISIITIIIVASYSFYNTKTAILERTFNQLTSVRVIKTNLLEKFFYNCTEEVKLAKYSSDIKNIVKKINNINNKQNFKFINDSLSIFNNKFINEISKKYYNNIYIIGENKLILPIKNQVKKTNINYKSIWDKSINNNKIYIQDFTKTDSVLYKFITLSSKITDSQNNNIGLIIFEISPNSIDSIMLEIDPTKGLGISGESYLVGNDFLMRSSSRFQKNSLLNTIVKTKATISIFLNKPGTKIVKDYRNISVLSSFAKVNIQNLDWGILAEIDYKEATIDIYKIRNEIIFISIFIFIIVLVVVIILSRKITYPIQKLNQAAQEVGAGNLDIELKINSNDEIGELSKTFNKMIEKLKTQTKELEKAKIKSISSVFNGQESERQRLSRELHDSLGQLLIGLKLKYESLINNSNLQNLNNNQLSELGILFDKTIDETRRISNNLMPAALSEFGLITAIRNICNEISDIIKININFNVEGINNNISQKTEIYIFRIIQEALTNIMKHSKATNASVNIIFTKNNISLTIQDNGIGFDKTINNKTEPNGLNNINDRVTLLFGKFIIKSEQNKGTKININIPINQNQNE